MAASRPSKLNRAVRAFSALILAAVCTVLLALPLGPLPALGPVFNPGSGVFAAPQHDLKGNLQLPGLQQPVTVDFDKYDVPHIFAANDHDLFFAQGYLEARNRMVEMDLLRRQAGGRLSEVLGAASIPSDTLQLTLGLRRTAVAEAAVLKQRDPQSFAAIQAFSDGVNSWLAQAQAHHKLPAPFGLLGYQPRPWSVADSMLVQAYMAEDLALSMQPLLRTIAAEKLGKAPADALFPEMPVNVQHPYNPGPFPQSAPVDVAALQQNQLDFGAGAGVGGAGASGTAVGSARPSAPGRAAASAAPSTVTASSSAAESAGERGALATTLVGIVNAVRHAAGPFTGMFQHLGNSNNFVVDGTLTDTGKPYLEGDPHLALTVPSIWFEVQLHSPDINAYGVSIPGSPAIVIGHNANVAWTETNTQNQQTFFYDEKTSADHPDAYQHDGTWVPFAHYKVDLPVKGEATRHLDIRWTVHGPVLSQLPGVPPLEGRTISMAYTGDLFSNDFGALLGLAKAHNAADVQQALRKWGAPTQNVAYATTQGDIGIISAGYYPLVDMSHSTPWQVMPGTGAADWTGLIPFERIPQIANPAWHFAFSANQREVGGSYPYYIGTAANFFDVGYRADTIFNFLNDPAKRPISQQTMATLQKSNFDTGASQFVPALERALLAQGDLTDQEQQALDTLSRWNFVMDKNKAAPAIWWAYLNAYVKDTFGPWWQSSGLDQVPGADLGSGMTPLVEALQVMSTAKPESDAFKRVADGPGGGHTWFDNPVTGQQRSREQVMRQALDDALKSLSKQMGTDMASWKWGTIHHRAIPSLLQEPALGVAPYPSDGGKYTPNAASGDPATHGPSWRMIANLAQPGSSWGVYPGGNNGDPKSRYHENQFPLWRAGQYKTLWFPSQAVASPGGHVVRVAHLEGSGQ